MKSLLVALALALSSQAVQSADLVMTEVGVWFDTIAPRGGKRTSGTMKVWFYSDNTCTAEFYWDNTKIVSGNGSWQPAALNRSVRRVTITSPGIVTKGTWNIATGYFNGTFSGGGYAGQVRCSWDFATPHWP